ncbi:MAG TPA: hypothetical protein PKZ83_17630 [bacterium]|nr:hypothetical protein [bacterium]
MAKQQISFYLLPINPIYGEVVTNIYLSLDNGRSDAIDALNALKQNERDRIIDLLTRLATTPNYRSKQITEKIKGYSYGEMTPHPHRFYFFRACRNNVIIFAYALKKKDSFKDVFYRDLDRKRATYAAEFEERFGQAN